MSRSSEFSDSMRNAPPDALPAAIGDRVRFALTQPNPDGHTATQMQGDGYVMAIVGGGPAGGAPIYLVAVRGYAGILSLPGRACQVIEAGALTRRLTVS